MTRNRWHIIREDNCLTVTRALPVRFDVVAETVVPDGSRRRLAQQVRQDLWRRLQDVRGFQPAVQVTREAGGCRITAGGRIAGHFPKARIESEIADLLASPKHRDRWSAQAAHRTHARGDLAHG
ncbi:hypothetical protein SAMN05444000_1175 [Shimia gijangensis]|uniref:Uncharacterized protein n=1 Tax=Shimia gijangensis TaxID=1470563 RepID=A0A1M6NY27_9RHOB|nr:hypothetical protein [Shimia gijangensis]SHK00647.1 hypothetical protein SAMN05444000_1175 [Shimia gijangensis]